MMELVIWLVVVNFLAFFISQSKYTKPIRLKLGVYRDNNTNKLKPTYILLFQLSKCHFCLAFWMGIFILSWNGQPIKTLFGIDFFFNFILDGIFSLFLNILLVITYGLYLKTYQIIKKQLKW